jgi:hypothetical protein
MLRGGFVIALVEINASDIKSSFKLYISRVEFYSPDTSLDLMIVLL